MTGLWRVQWMFRRDSDARVLAGLIREFPTEAEARTYMASERAEVSPRRWMLLQFRPAWETVAECRPTIEELIERSSLGTPEAVAMRATVSDEEARRCVERAKELGAMGERT